MHKKTVLRKLGDRSIKAYLTPKEAREELKYPRACIKEDSCLDYDWSDVVGVHFTSNQTNSPEDFILYSMVICNIDFEIIFKSESQIKFDLEEAPQDTMLPQTKQKIQRAIKGKVVVGFNMGKLFDLLRVEHNSFIDIKYLCPHPFPHRQTLRHIAREVLGIFIARSPLDCRGRGRDRGRRRLWRDRYYDRDEIGRPGTLYDSSDDQRREWRREYYRPKNRIVDKTIEDASICLKIAEKHIKEGRGILTTLTTQNKRFENVDEVLIEAQIHKEELCALFLRGSRALGIELELDEYFSDWDYVCVLDTTATINSVLLKLPSVDLLVFDRKSFLIYINGNDLPMLQLFYLPSQYVFINKILPPFISIEHLKDSLIYHLKKTDGKMSFYSKIFYSHFWPNSSLIPNKEQKQNNGRQNRRMQRVLYQHHELQRMSKSGVECNSKPTYVKWKFIKLMHLEIRLLDSFIQLKNSHQILNPLSKTPFWKKIVEECLSKCHFTAYRACKEEVNRLLGEVFGSQQLLSHQFKLFSNLQHHLSTSRRRRGYPRDDIHWRARGTRRWEIQPYYFQMPRRYQAMNRPLDEQEFEGFRRPGCNRWEATEVILNPSTQKRIHLSPLLAYINSNHNLINRQFSNLFSQYFLEPSKFYQINYFHKTDQKQLHDDEFACFTNFASKEHCNMELPLVQEAVSSIFRSHQTHLLNRIALQNLVCLMYKPFQEYQHIKKQQEIVKDFETRKFDVFQKRDGVLAVLYFAGCGWIVGSKKTPDGREIAATDGKSLSQQFTRVFTELGYSFPKSEDSHKVFLFELLSTKIHNTLSKDKDQLLLTGIRNMNTLQEEDPELSQAKYGWIGAQKINVEANCLEKLFSQCEERQNFEGFILRDRNFNRLIIRNSSVLKKKWEFKLQTLLNQRWNFFDNEHIDSNRTSYFIYSQIILKDRQERFKQLFPEHKMIVQQIQQYVKEVNNECKKLEEELGKEGWEGSKAEEIIGDKRMDVLIYFRSHCYTNYPELFQGKIQTAVSLPRAFNFILQYLNQRTSLKRFTIAPTQQHIDLPSI